MSLLNVFKPSPIASSPIQAEDSNGAVYVRPRYDIFQDHNAYYVDVDLPGVGKQDFGVRLHDGLLELFGERN